MAQPRLTPELRAWLEQEHRWGSHALAAISRLQDRGPSQNSGLDRFRARMALVELTGSVAAWAEGLRAGLARWEFAGAATAFADGPPFPQTDTRNTDYEQLSDYVQAGMTFLAALLQDDP